MDPKESLNLPATSLLVVSIASIVLMAISMVATILLALGVFGDQAAVQSDMAGGLGILRAVSYIFVIAPQVFIVFGALQMKRLQNHGIAMGAAIVSIVPCLSPCFIFGIPFGIWALVVLNKPEVKAAFAQK